jgi:hypothetical protein
VLTESLALIAWRDSTMPLASAGTPCARNCQHAVVHRKDITIVDLSHITFECGLLSVRSCIGAKLQ